MARRWMARLGCAGVMALVVGCDVLPDPAFDALAPVLRLRIVEVRPGPELESEVRLELTNTGNTFAAACLGPDRMLFGSGGGGGDIVHHAGCMRDVRIPAGGVMTWSETMYVPPGEIVLDVQILNPRRCSRMGCPGFFLTSSPFKPAPPQ